MHERTFEPGREGGQVLVIFALALVAIVAMTGLVLDGGDTFVQKRDMQNASDAAAMSGGYAYANGANSAAVVAAARATAAENGYVHGSDSVVVDVSMDAPGGGGRQVTVTISKPHRNQFSGIVGMTSWNVTTTAATIAGRPNAVMGAMPIIFNISAFETNGAGDGREVAYNEPPVGSSDIPSAPTSFNWTEYCDDCNADSATVRNLINDGGASQIVALTDHISPLNAGSHTTLFDALSDHVGEEFAVPIVDSQGNMVGWATFHLTGAVGGETKQIRGYFVSPVNPSAMTIIDDVGVGGDFGSYVVKLVN